MCERRGKDDFIGEDEAHFVCAILNTPIVERFIYATSDDRSYKIRPPVFVPPYDPEDDRHARLSAISREAHSDSESLDDLRSESEFLYLSICRDQAYDTVDTQIAYARLSEISSHPETLIRGGALAQALLELESE